MEEVCTSVGDIILEDLAEDRILQVGVEHKLAGVDRMTQPPVEDRIQVEAEHKLAGRPV